MKNRLKIGLSILATTLLVGCGGSSSSDSNNNQTDSNNSSSNSTSEITEDNLKEVTQTLISNPKNFDTVKYTTTEANNLSKLKMKTTTTPCVSGNLEIDRTVNGFSIDNLEQARSNTLTFNQCKTQAGDIFDGKVRVDYKPYISISDLKNLNEESVIKGADKNVTLLTDYTYTSASGYIIKTKANSKLQSNLDANQEYRFELLNLNATSGATNYRVDDLNTRTYADSSSKKLCFKSGTIYFNNAQNYMEITADETCTYEFIWQNGVLQAGGKVELVADNKKRIKIEATADNELTAYLNGHKVSVIDTTLSSSQP